jgi:hypothetical protein
MRLPKATKGREDDLKMRKRRGKEEAKKRQRHLKKIAASLGQPICNIGGKPT